MGVLRDWFGPSKDEIWSQLSQEIGADFEKGGIFKGGKMVLSHKQWEITLDTFTEHHGNHHQTYTRIRAPFVNADGLRFIVYRKSIFSGIGKMFGMQDIEIGDAFFDEQFIIKGQPEDQVQRLFRNPEIARLIQNQPKIYLHVKDDEGWFSQKFPEGVDELYFQTSGVIKDKQRLKELFDLFSAVLNELCRIGSAYQNEPGVSLK
jgi:hypothetical protein